MLLLISLDTGAAMKLWNAVPASMLWRLSMVGSGLINKMERY